MQLSSNILTRLHQTAVEAATQAGQYIATHKPQSVEHKTAGSSDASQVVTEVDLASQTIILEKLKPGIKTYDLGLLAEEEEDNGSRLEKEYFWCIDPLDGTLPFIEGRAGYAVAIALINKIGTPLIGVVYAPLAHNCYSAISGLGVWKNGEKLIIPEKKEVFSIYHHRSLLKNPDYKEILTNLELKFNCQGHQNFKYIHHGGAIMNAIWSIENQPSYYIALPKKEQGGGCIWDYAATVCIYKELGLKVTDYYGKPLMLNHPETIYMNAFGVRFENY